MLIKDVKNITETKFITLKCTTYLDKETNEKQWFWVSRNNFTKAVMIVPYFSEGWKTKPNHAGYEEIIKVVMIKEFRVPIEDYEYGFPAGLIDGDESIDTAVRRELLEETGYKVKNILQVSPFLINTAGLSDEASAIAFVEVDPKPQETAQESSEDIQVLTMSRNEVIDLMRQPVHFGAKAWLILNQFCKTGSIF